MLSLISQIFFTADEDSFKYDSMEGSPDSSLPENANAKPVSASIDLCELAEAAPSAGRRKSLRGKTAEVSFDLTDGSFEPLPQKRSRRAADTVGTIIDTVELDSEPREQTNSSFSNVSQDSMASNDSSASKTKMRRGRGRPPKTRRALAPKIQAAPKVPKPKRLTLKQALAITSAPIPKPKETSKPAAVALPRPVRSPPQAPNVERLTRSSAVDLTGDIHLDSMHSSAPLFQKQAGKPLEESVSDLDTSFDDTVRIKIKINGTIKAFSFRRYQRFLDLYKQIAEEEGIPMSSLFFYDGDKRIHADDTPHSAKYKISTIYTCHIMSGVSQNLKQLTNKNNLEIKFQSDKWKKPIALKVSKIDTFTTIVGILCEQVGFRPNQVSLRFDGDKLDLSETPMDLDFEGGEIIDCKVSG